MNFISIGTPKNAKILKAVNEKKKFNERAFSEELFGVNWIEKEK